MAKELPKRSEVKEEYTWKLSDMYDTKEAWEQELSQITTITAEVEKMQGKVTASARDLLFVLEQSAKAEQKIELAFNYAQRLFDQDQKNTTHQAMSQKIYGMYVDYSSRTAFVTPEILAAEESVVEAYMSKVPELELYRKQIQEIQRRKGHSLSAEMEKLVAMTGEMSETASAVYSIMNNADFIYPEITDENGERVRLSHGNFVPMLESANRLVRKDAFENYYSVYRQYANTLAALYNGQVKQQMFHAKARKYDSTLEASVDANNVPSKVYYNLVDTVNKNMDKMHRYVSIRKKCLGVEELHMYDVYTPMIADAAKKISY
ncbi:MAG: oligoendopeptidase F, partial [Lachnospiraceae bacterium]|nr:oligoendopeptidase F [Lachnospiraceae bacterium]